MLTIHDLSFSIVGRPLFEKTSLALPAGIKAGFVGRNGSGKTTLFNLILKHLSPDEGDISVHPKWRVGTVAQEAPASETTILDMVLEADAERALLLKQAEIETEPGRISEIYMRLADIESHTAEARASNILRGLGFGADQHNDPCSSLSGGWRMRVALAGVLFSQPDLLLLDEPTNYLDLEGALWLEKYLATYPHTIFLISHDRGLLNRAVNSIVHLEHGKLTLYKGAYNTFEATRRARMELSGKAREKQLAQIAHMQAFVDRFGASATKAKQAQSRVKRIAKLQPMDVMVDESSLPFSFPQPKERMASPMLNLENVSVGYDDQPVLSRITQRIDPEDRIALVGVNGNGKSTFAKLLAGDLKKMDGIFHRGKKLEIAYFAQHQMDILKPDQTVLEHIEPLTPHMSESQRRSRVAQMGLTTTKMLTLAKNLSGGERARLLLGLITFKGPGMMILDEPTNHLDIDSRDALVHALNEYKGAVLIISHDRHLIDATVDEIWIAENGEIRVLDDDMAGYENSILSKLSGSERKKKGQNQAKKSGNRKKERQEAAARRAGLSPLRKEIRAAEKRVEELQKQLEKLEVTLGDESLYEGDPQKSKELLQQRAQLRSKLEDAENLWMEKSAKLEKQAD
ncbi:MAG: ABC-F family ATP-binding cassette domain-containing protein [Devosiaceae bacterium]|nr:ABC-F family ATP-binding cassette domain-containing protein [Devosiaceae bacterium]